MDDEMLPEYDFSNARLNPYIKDKKNITIRLEARAINYFKELSKLLVLPPTISKLLKIKQKYPKSIPIDAVEEQPLADPRSALFQPKPVHLQRLEYH